MRTNSNSHNSYKGRRVDFEPYAASLFIPHLFNGPFRARQGCGATALALLTGVRPELVAAENKSRHYSDRFMQRFLRAREFRIQRLAPRIIAAARTRISEYHVILLSQLLLPDEGTWGVLHGNSYYHNFHVYELSFLSLLNKPLLSAYLVFHPAWRYWHVDEKPDKSRKFVPRNRATRLSAVSRLWGDAF